MTDTTKTDRTPYYIDPATVIEIWAIANKVTLPNPAELEAFAHGAGMTTQLPLPETIGGFIGAIIINIPNSIDTTQRLEDPISWPDYYEGLARHIADHHSRRIHGHAMTTHAVAIATTKLTSTGPGLIADGALWTPKNFFDTYIGTLIAHGVDICPPAPPNKGQDNESHHNG